MVTVTDTAAPDISPPADITFEATDTLTPLGRTHYGTATSGDDTADITDDAPDAFPLGDTTITWTATDKSTNEMIAHQVVTVVDTTAPMITLLGANPQTVKPGSTYRDPGATATDAVDDNDVLTTQIAAASTVDTGTVGDYTVTYTVSDNATNAATPEIRMVIVTDAVAPDITAPPDMTFEATATLTPLDRSDYGTATSTDGNADITDDAPAAFPLGATTITWTATDPATNEMMATQVVTIVDTTKPVIVLLGANPQTVEFGTAYTELNATATDEVDDDDELTRRIVIDANAVDVDLIGTYAVTYDVTDAEGNAADRVTRTVMVTDTAAPDISPPADMTFEATDTLTPLDRADYGTATSGDDTADITDDAPDAFPLGATTITWTATDPATNEMMATQVVTIVDTTPPDIALLGTNPQTVEFGSIYNDPGASATDAVDDDDELTIRIAAVSTVDTGTVGDYTVTYTVSDKATNAATPVIRMVTVTDTEAPDIIAPADITFEATDTLTPLGRTHYGTATSSDREAMITDDAPLAFSVGVHTITWTATDPATNEMMATQVVTIVDTTPPVIALLGDNPQTVEFGTAYTELNATATDEVDDDIKLTARIVADANAVDTGTVGDYTVTYTVSDTATNAATPVIRTVTVTDTEAPDIIAPADITFEATDTLTPLGRTHYGTATSGDDTADITDDAPDAFPLGDTTITWTATDKSTNEMMATQVVTVVDTTAPMITLLGANPQTVKPGSTYRDPGATATDAVDDNDVLTTQIAAASTVDTGTVGDYTVTYTVSDNATNAATPEIRMVIVTDAVAPDITAPPDMTFEATATLTPLDRSDYGTATSTDGNADITDDAPAAFPLGETMIEWTAIDTNNLRSYAQQMITVEDTIKPIIMLLGDNPMTIEVDENYVEFGATAVDRMAGDLTDQIIIDATEIDTNTVGTYTVTYAVADIQNNQTQASRSVQVLAGPDFADLNRVILSEVARTMADQNVNAVVRRIEQVGGKAADTTSLGGQSSLAGIITAQGRAIADGQFNIKRLLADTDFVLPLGASEGTAEGASEGASEETSRLTFWGAGDYRNISDSDQVTWNGDLFSLHLGLDTQLSDNLVAGASLSWNQVALDYSNYTSTQSLDRAGRTASSGDYALEMTSIHPYVGWNLGRLDFWATLGYGEGELEITDDGAPLARHLSSDLNLQTLALGASGLLLEAGTNSLRAKAEALRTELEVMGNAQLAALSLDVSRLRMTLEATGTWSLDSGGQLGLVAEWGLRYDGGAGKTGSGTEIGSGLRYVSAANRLTLEAKARGVSHYKGGVEEWGISGLIKFQGSSDDGQGLSFSLMPAYGEATNSNLQQLWQQGLNPDDGDIGRQDYAPRLDLRLNYGMLAPGGRGLLTPYGEMTFGDSSNIYHLGLMWQSGTFSDVKLVAERRESLDATENSILLEGTISF